MKVQGFVIVSGVAAGAAVLYLFWRRREEHANWKEVATVEKMFVHPVKSCRGISVDSFGIFEKGVMINNSEIGDRRFMMVYENGRFATIRQFPRMALIQSSIVNKERIRLEAPGMRPFELNIPPYGSGKVLEYKMWRGCKVQGADCGDEVAAWLQKFTGATNARMVFHHKRFPPKQRNKLMGFDHLGVYTKEPLKSGFQDASPFNMVSQASIDLLNTKLNPDHQVTERWFRPNILLTGCEAFAEDTWKRIRIGSAEFVFAKNTDRCQLTNVNPETGVKDPAGTTLTTLSAFRLGTPEERPLYGKAPKFCVDFVVVREGKINLGDKVFAHAG